MKLTGFSPTTITLQSDPSTTFTFSPLTAAQRLDILSGVQDSAKYGSAMLLALESAVTGWSGITDANGVPAAFNKEQLKYLPTEVLIEVSSAILAAAKLGDDEKKA